MISLILKLCRVRLRWWWTTVIVLLDLVIVVLIAGACGIAYVDVHGKKLWADYRADAEKRGVKLDFAEFIPPPVPDSENYAAIPLFERAFALGQSGREKEVLDFPSIPKGPPKTPAWLREVERSKPHVVERLLKDTKKPEPAEPPPTRIEAIRNEFVKRKLIPPEAMDIPPAEAVLQGLERFKSQLAELHEAASRPKCRFPTDWRLALTAKLPHYTVLMSAGRAWDARMRANLELGHVDLAFADLQDSVAAHRAMRTEPTLIAWLVRISHLAIARDIIALGLRNHQWTETQLAAIERALEEIDCLADIQYALSSERASANQTADWVFGFYQPDGVPPPDAGNGLGGGSLEKTRRIAGWGRWNQTFINQSYDEYLAHLDLAKGRWDGGFEVEHDVGKVEGMERYLLAFAILINPAFDGFIQRALWTHTQHQLVRTAIAIERHRLANGALPAKLDELVPKYLPAVPLDVFTGNPLIYRPGSNGAFQLFGVGLNRVDDDGEGGGEESPKAPDWVWRTSDGA